MNSKNKYYLCGSKIKVMNLSMYLEKYSDESKCIEYLRDLRIKEGVKCKKCGHTEHYYRKGDLKFECKSCHNRQSIRCGTVMEHSNLPIRYWLLCIKLMTLTKKSFSALEMQRLIGHKRYEPIWYMMHKIRLVMGKRDSEYKLSNYVEMDEGFFERVDNKEVKDSNKEIEKKKKKKEKRGRGSESQTKVLVMIESKPIQEEKCTYKPNRKVGYLKMVVMEDLKGDSIIDVVKDNVEKEANALTDGYKGYSKLKEIISEHQVIVEYDKTKSSKMFPWVNRAISNAKKMLLGIHHNCINDKYIQNYLNEFCYKFNRRYFGEKLTDRLILATIKNTWY